MYYGCTLTPVSFQKFSYRKDTVHLHLFVTEVFNFLKWSEAFICSCDFVSIVIFVFSKIYDDMSQGLCFILIRIHVNQR